MRLAARGMTLVEVTIVVLILGILAMVVAPRLTNAQYDARESALEVDLTVANRQIELYMAEHNGYPPERHEMGVLDPLGMVNRLTRRTDPDGKLNPAGECGPYLVEWPKNPFAPDAVADKIVFGMETTSPRTNASGWYYSYKTHRLYPNSTTGGEDLD